MFNILITPHLKIVGFFKKKKKGPLYNCYVEPQKVKMIDADILNILKDVQNKMQSTTFCGWVSRLGPCHWAIQLIFI